MDGTWHSPVCELKHCAPPGVGITAIADVSNSEKHAENRIGAGQRILLTVLTVQTDMQDGHETYAGTV